MARCVFRDGTVVEDYGRPYVVAEVNSSHNGDINVAKLMIDASAEIGCDCVKFQSWSADSLYSKTYYDANPIAKRFVKKFSLAPSELRDLAYYCNNKGLQFSSTPYSEDEVDFLVDECNVPYIKIASMEVNNPRFLEFIGKKGVPIVLSTGMSSFDEVDYAVSVLEKSGVTQMVILHCVSIYPAELEAVNLNNILGLRERYPKYPIGFSDHTEGDAASVAATALGVALIEKHLTLDHSKVGMDNGMATEPEQFKILVNKCRSIQVAMGSKERTVSKAELLQRSNMRRSIIATRDISAGSIIRECDLYAKRPGTGIPPTEYDKVIGKRATKNIEADTLIRPEDID